MSDNPKDMPLLEVVVCKHKLYAIRELHRVVEEGDSPARFRRYAIREEK
jgi:hypothetical protein